jgi:hypothetical protein
MIDVRFASFEQFKLGSVLFDPFDSFAVANMTAQFESGTP